MNATIDFIPHKNGVDPVKTATGFAPLIPGANESGSWQATPDSGTLSPRSDSLLLTACPSSSAQTETLELCPRSKSPQVKTYRPLARRLIHFICKGLVLNHHKLAETKQKTKQNRIH